MSDENRKRTGQFVEFSHAQILGELATDEEKNLQSQLLDRRMTWSEIDRRIKAIVAHPYTQLEMLIQSVEELNKEVQLVLLKETLHRVDGGHRVNAPIDA